MTELDIVVQWLLSDPANAQRDAHAIYLRVLAASSRRLCANVNCGQLFELQPGERAHKKYCDAVCCTRARDAAAQQRRRQRKAAS